MIFGNFIYKINDIWEFYHSHGHSTKRDMKLREEYDKITLSYLRRQHIHCVALGGYMSIVTHIIFRAHPTINVHPADLSIIDPKTGRRKFIGEHAVRDAILAGENCIRSSTHLATEEVDGGPLLLISRPVQLKIPSSITLEMLQSPENKDLLETLTDQHQDELKKVGDWIIFPLTLLYIAKGLVAQDEHGIIYIEGQPRPHGLKLG
ncbi:MAG: formyltransferase family protein [Candidatus Helarchaeota archaeon]